jgi:fibronectin type 3 domain-containing protein
MMILKNNCKDFLQRRKLMKRLLLTILTVALVFLINGCKSPDVPQKPAVDPAMPKVTELKTLSDITEIGLEWSPIHDLMVEGYYIYRAEADNNNGLLDRVAVIGDRYVSHYVDTKLSPQTNYIYRISSFNKDKQESEPSTPIVVSTKTTIESIPFAQAMTNLPNRIKIIWRPHPSERVSSYIIERNDFSSTKWEQIAVVNGKLSAEYIDAGLRDSKAYRYRVKAKTYDGLVSAPSQIIEAQTKPLPPVVENLKSTRNLPKKIVISWDASVHTEADYYNVYRAGKMNFFYSHIVKTKNTRYEDVIQEDGALRYYYVTVTDKDGLESPRQSVPLTGATLEVPSAPAVNVIRHDGRSIMIGWKDTSARAVKYQIVRTSKSGILTYTNIADNTFVDKDVLQGLEYSYEVFAIDVNGLISKPCEKAVIVIPKN